MKDLKKHRTISDLVDIAIARAEAHRYHLNLTLREMRMAKLRLWQKDDAIIADSCFAPGESRTGFKEVILADLDDEEVIMLGDGSYVRAEDIVDEDPSDGDDDDDDDDDKDTENEQP